MEPHDPPPPYSETWTDSSSSIAPGLGPSPVIGTGSDDASLAASSPTRSSDIIYTPPETPRGSQHSFPGGEPLSASIPPSTPTRAGGAQEPTAGEHARIYRSNASAQAYFDSRPAATDKAFSDQQLHVVIPIRVTERTTSADLPLPPALSHDSSHDVTDQDWQTFVNYLIPDHIARANSSLLSRKEVSASAAGLDDSGPARSSHDINSPVVASSRSGVGEGSLVAAQLDQIRSTYPEHAAAERDRIARDTTLEWNAGFFGPRGVTVRLDLSPSSESPSYDSAGASQRQGSGSQRMPGAWDSEPGERARQQQQQQQQAPSPPSARQAQQQQQQQSYGFSRWNPFGSQALRFGPVTIDGDRVSIGNSLEVDKSGVRWRGVPIEGMTSPSGLSQQHRDSPWGASSGAAHGPFRGGLFGGGGRGRGGWGWAGAHHGHGHRSPCPGSEERASRGQGAASHAGQSTAQSRVPPEAVRNSNHNDDDNDDHSLSGSSRSSASSASVSSIGSLPDYDDLRDAQLPVVKQSVSVWLAHPEQPVTREMLRAAKAEIKSAKRAHPGRPAAGSSRGPHSQQLEPQALGSQEQLPPPPTYDEVQAAETARLREEVRVLMAAWDGLKKDQKRQRRADKKQRRAQRKLARRERKTQRKATRAAVRSERAAARGAERSRRRRGEEVPEVAWMHGLAEHRGSAERDAARHAQQRQQEELLHQQEMERAQQQRARDELLRQQEAARQNHWSQSGLGRTRGGGAGAHGGGWSPFGSLARGGPAPWYTPEVHVPHIQIPHVHVQPNVFAASGPFHPHVATPVHRSGPGAYGPRGASWSAPHPHDHGRGHDHQQQHTPGAWSQNPGLQYPHPDGRDDYDDYDEDKRSEEFRISMADNDRDQQDIDLDLDDLSIANKKYKQADELEAQIADKIARLSLLGQQHGASGRQDSETTNQAEAVALERDMENLLRDVEKLRVEADEEVARRLEMD